MRFSTGIAVTLSASWTIAGSIHTDPGVGTIFDFNGTQGESIVAHAAVAINFCAVNASASCRMESIVQSEPPDTKTWVADAVASGGAGDHQVGRASTLNLNGSASANVPCVLCWEYEGQSGPNPFAGAVVDAPPYRLLRFFLVGTGDATTSISFGPVSSSGTTDIRGLEISPTVAASVNGDSSHLPYPVNSTVFTGYLGSTAAVSVALNSCTFSIGDENAQATDNFSQIYPNIPAGTSISVPVSGQSSAGGGAASFSCANGGYGSASSGGAAQRSFDLSGVIRAMLGDYPDALTLYCPRYLGDPAPSFDAGSSFSRSYTQRSYSNSASAQAHTANSQPAQSQTKQKNEFADVGVSIVRSSLEANGDEPLPSRILLRAKQAPGMSLSQAETHLFDDFGAGWTGTGGASVSHDGAGLHITTSGGAGGATGTYSPARSLASYRYLRVPLKSVGAANVPVTVSVDGKSWTISTGGDGETVLRDIDLCAPGTGGLSAGQSDTWDGHWPLPTVTSATSGPFQVSGVSFGGIPAGKQIVVGSLLLARHDAPTVDCVPTLFASVYHPTNGTSEPFVEPEWPLLMGPLRQASSEVSSQDFVRRFLLVDTDGRQGPEERDFWYTRNSSEAAVSYSFNMDTLQGLCDQINAIDDSVVRWPGWTATPAVPAPTTPFVPGFPNEPPPETPYYFNAQELLAAEIRGGGILFSQDGAAYGWDLPTVDLAAQALFDGVRQCGLEGDIFAFAGGVAGPKPNGGGVDPLALRGGTILRAGAHGLVFDGSKQPKSGQEVLLKQSGATVAGGTSRADSYYHADNAPAAKSPTSAIVQAGSKTAPLSTLWTRHRHRVVFFVPALGTWISADISRAGRHVRAFDGDTLMVGFSNAFSVNVWNDGAVGTYPDARPCVRYDADGNLVLLFEMADSIVLLRSENDGRTWGVPLTVSTEGSFGALAISPAGMVYAFWRTPLGGIAGKILDTRGNIVYPQTGVINVASGVAEDAIAASCDPLTRRVFVYYRSDEGDLMVVISSDEGKTYMAGSGDVSGGEYSGIDDGTV